jgi:hypothetical protein
MGVRRAGSGLTWTSERTSPRRPPRLRAGAWSIATRRCAVLGAWTTDVRDRVDTRSPRCRHVCNCKPFDSCFLAQMFAPALLRRYSRLGGLREGRQAPRVRVVPALMRTDISLDRRGAEGAGASSPSLRLRTTLGKRRAATEGACHW